MFPGVSWSHLRQSTVLSEPFWRLCKFWRLSGLVWWIATRRGLLEAEGGEFPSNIDPLYRLRLLPAKSADLTFFEIPHMVLKRAISKMRVFKMRR